MLLAIGFLSCMDALAKWLISNGMNSVQLLAVRSLIIVPVILLVFAARGRLRDLLPQRPVAQVFRGLFGVVAPLAFFMGVARIPLTSAVVVFFSSIFMTTLLSVFFLGERVGMYRWVAILIGYCGVFIAISPASGGDGLGYALVLLASFAYSVLFISGRMLSRTESVASLVLFYNLGVGCVTLILLPWFWGLPTLQELGLMLLLSVFAVAGHFTITHAFALAEASLIAPFEYTAVLWALLFDILIWNVYPSWATWVGAAVIISSGLFVIYREYVHARQT